MLSDNIFSCLAHNEQRPYVGLVPGRHFISSQFRNFFYNGYRYTTISLQLSTVQQAMPCFSERGDPKFVGTGILNTPKYVVLIVTHTFSEENVNFMFVGYVQTVLRSLDRQ